MRILFPHNPLDISEPDGPYIQERDTLQRGGVKCSLFDFDALRSGFVPKPKILSGERVVYRGWMMGLEEYGLLVQQIVAHGGIPVASETDCRNHC